jgi:putative acetyltransferase
MTVIVRTEGADDAADIRDVVTAAFGRSGEADLVDRLRKGGDSVVSLVAVERRRIVGHVMLSWMTAPFRALGLAPVSVAPDQQRRGIGSLLIRTALERATRDGWEVVVVLGDPAYYSRFGFDPALASGFESPYAGPYLMALCLKGPLLVRTGRLDYAPAFAALEGH